MSAWRLLDHAPHRDPPAGGRSKRAIRAESCTRTLAKSTTHPSPRDHLWRSPVHVVGGTPVHNAAMAFVLGAAVGGMLMQQNNAANGGVSQSATPLADSAKANMHGVRNMFVLACKTIEPVSRCVPLAAHFRLLQPMLTLNLNF